MHIPDISYGRSQLLAELLHSRYVAERAKSEWLFVQANRKCHRPRLHVHRLPRTEQAQNTVTPLDTPLINLMQVLCAATPPSESATLTFGDASRWPGLNMQGITHVRLDMDVGGVVPLHMHPRATETLFLLKGRIYTGFISSANKAYTMTLQAGDMTVFPQAMTHFQVNVGNETAVAFNSYNSQNPGFLVTVNQMFDSNISSTVIERSFGIDSATEMILRNASLLGFHLNGWFRILLHVLCC